jgi:hypothetical protein
MVLSATFASAQQPTDAVRDQITLRGKVEGVDQKARTVTVRGEKGNVVTIDMPKSGLPFDQLQVGDEVTIAYFDRVGVRIKAADEPAVDRTDPPVATPSATAGILPGATVASQRVTTVTITAWDPATRVVSFTGPGGTKYERRLGDAIDAKVLAALKVGDRVDVTRTEAVRLSVESRTQVSVAATSDFRNRVTISALFGWDNQATGDVTKATAGQTTGGVPINIGDTSYDDVYGRMGMMRLGIGYRTTPRTEAVFNFVYSKSEADAPVSIGTAGTAGVPLNVQFEEHSFWGLEAGQRFYFTRVRITPFLGYLIGANRYGDIRATFVGVPTSATPGLAAADGKFFEKSWALSLGPTGGFLIGVGPIEFMFEAQLKWMGAMSDVDWLVEEGLKDINDESARWSYPLTAGARIRF